MFFYRDRKWSERLALSIGMFTRGEVGGRRHFHRHRLQSRRTGAGHFSADACTEPDSHGYFRRMGEKTRFAYLYARRSFRSRIAERTVMLPDGRKNTVWICCASGRFEYLCTIPVFFRNSIRRHENSHHRIRHDGARDRTCAYRPGPYGTFLRWMRGKRRNLQRSVWRRPMSPSSSPLPLRHSAMSRPVSGRECL